MDRINSADKTIKMFAGGLLTAMTGDPHISKDEKFLQDFIFAAEEALVAKNIPYCSPELECNKETGEIKCIRECRDCYQKTAHFLKEVDF